MSMLSAEKNATTMTQQQQIMRSNAMAIIHIHFLLLPALLISETLGSSPVGNEKSELAVCSAGAGSGRSKSLIIFLQSVFFD
jgi:hypothetical protein